MEMAKKKHNFHCEKCKAECHIYKKGKGHRVLVCPNCGVLATNPFSLGKALMGVAKTVPVVSTIAGALEGFSPSQAPTTQSQRAPLTHKPTFDYVGWALKEKTR